MNRPSDELDVLIREALGDADAELRDRFGEPSLPEMMVSVFRGRQRLETIATLVVILLFFGLSIFFAIRLFTAAGIREMLLWGAGLFVSWSSMIGFKMVSWLAMHRNAVTREIKRLELQMAQLARTIREEGGAESGDVG